MTAGVEALSDISSSFLHFGLPPWTAFLQSHIVELTAANTISARWVVESQIEVLRSSSLRILAKENRLARSNSIKSLQPRKPSTWIGWLAALTWWKCRKATESGLRSLSPHRLKEAHRRLKLCRAPSHVGQSWGQGGHKPSVVLYSFQTHLHAANVVLDLVQRCFYWRHASVNFLQRVQNFVGHLRTVTLLRVMSAARGTGFIGGR